MIYYRFKKVLAELYGDGELLRLTTDDSDGCYAFLEVINSLGFSNKLEFSSNKLYYNRLLNNHIPIELLREIYPEVDNVLKDETNKKIPEDFL